MRQKRAFRVPGNSLGLPWKEGQRWTCTRCGKGGPDRDDLALPPCTPREENRRVEFHDLEFHPREHDEAIQARHAARKGN